MPEGMGWLGPLINFMNRRRIKKFDTVWIPDQPDSGLTGPFMSKAVPNQQHIGWLSRFNARNGVSPRYDVMALVSGPEPQRTIFQDMLLSQLQETDLKSLLVAGEPGKPYQKQVGSVEVVNHLSVRNLEEAILSSRIVISRSGYSTVMDLMALKKEAIFIPTPQQPEQIFFANHFTENGIAYSSDQRKFSLPVALEKSKSFNGFRHYTTDPHYLTQAIDELLK